MFSDHLNDLLTQNRYSVAKFGVIVVKNTWHLYHMHTEWSFDTLSSCVYE